MPCENGWLAGHVLAGGALVHPEKAAATRPAVGLPEAERERERALLERLSCLHEALRWRTHLNLKVVDNVRGGGCIQYASDIIARRTASFTHDTTMAALRPKTEAEFEEIKALLWTFMKEDIYPNEQVYAQQCKEIGTSPSF
jgi:hypothetical protein